jgi:hypothetical protein
MSTLAEIFAAMGGTPPAGSANTPVTTVSTVNEQVANGEIYANGFYGTGIANGYAFRAETYALSTGTTDTFTLQLTGYASAPATVYFYNYTTEDRIEVYQGSTLVASTSSAIALTAADKTFLLSDAAGAFFNDNPDLYLKDFTVATPGYAAYAGKITWTHNPAGGTAYTIKTIEGGSSFDWRWVCEYPIDGFTVGCPPLPPVYTPPPPAPVVVTPTTSGGGCGCGKIACTAMNEEYGFGSFRQTVWLDHSTTLKPEYEKGYHYMFLPWVNYLYRGGGSGTGLGKFMKSWLEHVVKHRTADIWKQKKGKRDTLGQWYRAVFDPLCYYVGKLIKG